MSILFLKGDHDLEALTEVAYEIAAVREAIRRQRAAGREIGLVPTMGALHDGHARLIEVCRREADFAVVSIFVNPTQFGPGEDFERYPRTFAEDRRLCAAAGADLIFAPTSEEMYPSGPTGTFVEVPALSRGLEGASRPTHFRGVATVVTKLLQIVQPDLAYFGEKDYQQLQVIRRLVLDLNIPVTIVGVPTVREPDGLARSSRNRYLDDAHRRAALCLYAALRKGVEAVRAGESSAERVRQILRHEIESEPLARLDYADVVDAETLDPLERLNAERPARALVAARVGPARLIDNIALGVPGALD